MPIDILRAQANLQPISVQQMVDLSPNLFRASAKFLVAERHSLPLAVLGKDKTHALKRAAI